MSSLGFRRGFRPRKIVVLVLVLALLGTSGRALSSAATGAEGIDHGVSLADASRPLTSGEQTVFVVSAAYTHDRVIFPNDLEASISAWSLIQITATVPLGVVGGDVVVETDRGTSNGSPFEVGSSSLPDEGGEGTAWVASVSGDIASDTTWSENVLVTGDVVIVSGVTLTITPGVTVFFAAHSDDQADGYWTDRAEIHVYGVLLAEGTEAAPIYFTSNAADKAAGDWGSIVIRRNSTDSSLAYCVVHYAEEGIRFHASGEGGGSMGGEFRNCVIAHNNIGIFARVKPNWSSCGTLVEV